MVLRCGYTELKLSYTAQGGYIRLQGLTSGQVPAMLTPCIQKIYCALQMLRITHRSLDHHHLVF